jgi:ABC-type nitrate/sulfonate/bicarbonate transport system ATPase subunit
MVRQGPGGLEKSNGKHLPAQCREAYGHGATANKVIHGVNAEIADGEFIVIVGPSGCGKSTLLRMVAGLEEITGGEIAIGGGWSTTWSRPNATSPWCSRTTRSTRT